MCGLINSSLKSYNTRMYNMDLQFQFCLMELERHGLIIRATWNNSIIF